MIMNANEILDLEIDINMTFDQLGDFISSNGLLYDEYVIDDKGFVLLGKETSKVILYVKKIYYKSDGAEYYVNLHALHTFKSYEDAMDNINGVLSYYLYGFPYEIQNDEWGANFYDMDR